MSHLSILRTQFRDRAVLLDALRTLGYEVNPSANQKISANGRARTVEFTVTPPYSAPIGFIPGKNGYRIVADWFLIQLDRKIVRDGSRAPGPRAKGSPARPNSAICRRGSARMALSA